MKPTTIAIMQPYFIPYAGYFRLLTESDLFVIYDCVQFPRRGWVHRNRLIDGAGAKRWLTLPLEKGPQTLLIKDLQFRRDAQEAVDRQLWHFPGVIAASAAAPSIIRGLRDVRGSPLDYIENLMSEVACYLGLPWRVIRSSTMNLPRALRGQARIIEIVRQVGGRQYLNAPLGRTLYEAVVFAEAGIKLRFLPVYPGPHASILDRILSEDREKLAAEIRAATTPHSAI